METNPFADESELGRNSVGPSRKSAKERPSFFGIEDPGLREHRLRMSGPEVDKHFNPSRGIFEGGGASQGGLGSQFSKQKSGAVGSKGGGGLDAAGRMSRGFGGPGLVSAGGVGATHQAFGAAFKSQNDSRLTGRRESRREQIQDAGGLARAEAEERLQEIENEKQDARRAVRGQVRAAIQGACDRAARGGDGGPEAAGAVQAQVADASGKRLRLYLSGRGMAELSWLDGDATTGERSVCFRAYDKRQTSLEYKENYFDPRRTLLELHLSSNLLENLDPQINSTSLPSLRVLTARCNLIRAVSLDSLFGLTQLDLSHNLLTDFPALGAAATAKQPSKLIQLNLRANQLRSWDSFPNIAALGALESLEVTGHTRRAAECLPGHEDLAYPGLSFGRGDGPDGRTGFERVVEELAGLPRLRSLRMDEELIQAENNRYYAGNGLEGGYSSGFALLRAVQAHDSGAGGPGKGGAGGAEAGRSPQKGVTPGGPQGGAGGKSFPALCYFNHEEARSYMAARDGKSGEGEGKAAKKKKKGGGDDQDAEAAEEQPQDAGAGRPRGRKAGVKPKLAEMIDTLELANRTEEYIGRDATGPARDGQGGRGRLVDELLVQVVKAVEKADDRVQWASELEAEFGLAGAGPSGGGKGGRKAAAAKEDGEAPGFEDSVEAFLQNCVMLIDNSDQATQLATLRILARVCPLDWTERAAPRREAEDVEDMAPGFGACCFQALRDIAESGERLREAVSQQLAELVIPAMFANGPNGSPAEARDVPLAIIVGVRDWVRDDPGQKHLLTPLFRRQQVKRWLEKMDSEQKLQEKGNADPDGPARARKAAHNKAERDRLAYSRAVLTLVSAGVATEDGEENENVDIILQDELCDEITAIFQSVAADRDDDRYIPCLNIIANLSNASYEAADKFVSKDQREKKGGNGSQDAGGDPGEQNGRESQQEQEAPPIDELLLEEIRRYMETEYLHRDDLPSAKERRGGRGSERRPAGGLADQDIGPLTGRAALRRAEVLAAQITTLGGLLQTTSRYLRGQILRSSVVQDLMTVMGHPVSEPILLTAVCTFAKDLYETDELILAARAEAGDEQGSGSDSGLQENVKSFSLGYYYTLLSGDDGAVAQLIPLLGGATYPALLGLTRRYDDGGGEDTHRLFFNEGGSVLAAQETHDLARRADDSRLEELGAGVSPEERERRIVESLSKLEDEYVVALFVRIINLIEHFCVKGAEATEESEFLQIAGALDAAGREAALFRCLAIPGDEVKLAVVQCLLQVPIAQLEDGEQASILEIAEKCPDIGAGQTELVLSNVFWLLTKFVTTDVKGESDAAGSSRTFQEFFGASSIRVALGLLERNLRRESSLAEEDGEKYALSLAILNFLKAATEKAPLMHPHMRQPQHWAIFRQIMINEDTHSSATIHEVPVDLENTSVAHSAQCLIEVISGKDSILPYRDVSLRVMMRMADILQAAHECEFVRITSKTGVADEDEDEGEGDESEGKRDRDEEDEEKQDSGQGGIGGAIEEQQRTGYATKRRKELDFWRDKPQFFTAQLGRLEKGQTKVRARDGEAAEARNKAMIADMATQHESFTLNGGFGLLMVFLTAKYPDNYERIKMLSSAEFVNTGGRGSMHKVLPMKLKAWADDFAEKYVSAEKPDPEEALHHTEAREYVDDKYIDPFKIRREFSQRAARQVQAERAEKQRQLQKEQRARVAADLSEDELDEEPHHHHAQDDEKQSEKRHSSRLEGADQTPEEKLKADSRKAEAEIKAIKKQLAEHSEKTSEAAYRSRMQLEELGLEFFESQLPTEDPSYKANAEKQLKDDLRLQKESQQAERGLKDERVDGIADRKLRSLTVAAFLRCLYASIEYAPGLELKNAAIKNIQDPTVFKAITQLCDACDWDDRANLGAKYLRLMRNCIEIPSDQDYEGVSKLFHYEIISIVIQRALGKIVDKLKKGLELTGGDQVTVYELSLTFYVIINQANNFEFWKGAVYKGRPFDLDLLKQQRRFEAAIRAKKARGAAADAGVTAVAEQDELETLTQRKCQYKHGAQRRKGGFDPKTFLVEPADLRREPRPQDQAVEYMVLKIFSTQSIFSLVDILFKDMAEDAEQLKDVDAEDEEGGGTEQATDHEGGDAALDSEEGSSYDDSGDEESSQDRQEGGSDDENEDGFPDDERAQEEDQPEGEEGEQGTGDNDDGEESEGSESDPETEAFLARKGLLTIERIKDIVGEIMSTCESRLQFQILEYIVKGKVFEKKIIRESFLQEVLNAQGNASFATAIEYYINDEFKNQATGELANKTILGAASGRHERVLEFSAVDINRSVVDWEQYVYDEKKHNLGDKEAMKGQDIITGSLANVNFLNRLFTLSNQGIQVMKNIDRGDRCPTCQDFAFCPKGPAPIYQVGKEAIECVVQFPQMPQKLVLIYVDNGLKFQMTLNIPSYTKAAKIYKKLSGLLDYTRYEREQQRKLGEADYSGPKEEAPLTITDVLVQHALQQVCAAIYDEFHGGIVLDELDERLKRVQPFEPEAVLKLELITATLRPNDLMSDRYYQLRIARHIGKMQVKFLNRGKKEPAFSAYVRQCDVTNAEANVVPEPVSIAIINDNVVMLRENWRAWRRCEDNRVESPAGLESVSLESRGEDDEEDEEADDQAEEARRKREAAAKSYKAEEERAEAEAEKLVAGAAGRPRAQEMMRRCLRVEAVLRRAAKGEPCLFHVVAVIPVAEILEMQIHQGKDPSIEMACYPAELERSAEEWPSADGEAEEARKDHYRIGILFSGDMERQKFIGGVIGARNGEDEPWRSIRDAQAARAKKEAELRGSDDEAEPSEEEEEEPELGVEEPQTMVFYE